MMADKEQRVCVKFCFLLGTVRNLTTAQCYCCSGFLSKCLLGGSAIFMMADNKEQLWCGSQVPNSPYQKTKLHAQSLFFIISHHKNRQTS
jgi:hypothetical protein